MKWIAEFPSTNGKIVVGLFLASVYIITALAADLLGRPLQDATHVAVATFLGALIGIATYQYKVKRETHIETPPARPDVEDAPALNGKTAAAPDPAPTTASMVRDD